MPSFPRAGVELYFEERGVGFPLVLQTGGAGDGRMWLEAGYVGALVGYRAILFDHRGRGRSARPERLEQHLLAEFVADVVALADHLGLERYGYVGYSAGAFVGYHLAARDPRVAALVALGGVLAEDGDEDGGSGYRAAVEDAGMEGLNAVVEQGERIQLPAWLRRQFAETDRGQFLLTAQAWAEEPEPWDLLAAIRCPTLLVLGAGEDPAGAGEQMAARMAEAELVYVPRRGHVGAFLEVGQVAPRLRTFLDRTVARAAPG